MNDCSHLHWVDGATVLVVEPIREGVERLTAEEFGLVRGMQPARQREFAAGRRAGRYALAALNEAPTSISIGSGGEPLWPPGVVGSLSHTATCAAALVSRAPGYLSLGVDLDDDRLIGDRAALDLMSGEEVALIEEQRCANRSLAQNMVFCAKEAIFKCQFPLTRNAELDFGDVQIVASTVPRAVGVRCLRDDVLLQAHLERIVVFFENIQSLRVALAFSLDRLCPGNV